MDIFHRVLNFERTNNDVKNWLINHGFSEMEKYKEENNNYIFYNK